MFIDGECHKRSPPGESCIATEQCSGGSVCEEQTCACPPGTKQMGGFCQEEIKCLPSQILHAGLCRNKARLGESCMISKQCQEGSIFERIVFSILILFIGASCIQGSCECKKGFVERSGKCVSPKAPPPATIGPTVAPIPESPSGRPLISQNKCRILNTFRNFSFPFLKYFSSCLHLLESKF